MRDKTPSTNRAGAENLAASVGKSFTFEGATDTSISVSINADLLQFGSLHRLSEESNQKNFSKRLLTNKPLELNTVEMLEAELTNQGILPVIVDSSSTLAQHIAHEVNIWRWRGRRVGTGGAKLHFNVTLAPYLIAKGHQLARYLELDSPIGNDSPSLISQPSNAWRINLGNKSQVTEKLEYLDSFAAYLLGNFNEARDKYQRGLNIVLKSLLGHEQQEARLPSKEKLTLTLPLTSNNFFDKLKTLREK